MSVNKKIFKKLFHINIIKHIQSLTRQYIMKGGFFMKFYDEVDTIEVNTFDCDCAPECDNFDDGCDCDCTCD